MEWFEVIHIRSFNQDAMKRAVLVFSQQVITDCKGKMMRIKLLQDV